MTDLSFEAADHVADMAAGLYRRIHEQIDIYLKQQAKALGIDEKDIAQKITQVYHPADSCNLFTYLYQDRPILGVRIADNRLSIVFDLPNLQKPTSGSPSTPSQQEAQHALRQ